MESGAIRIKSLKSRLWVQLLYFRCKGGVAHRSPPRRFFGECISRIAIRFARGNLFAMRKMAGNVRGYYTMEVGRRYWIGVGVVDVIYLARGIRICERALDAASNNDTAPAKASGPSSCAAKGK